MKENGDKKSRSKLLMFAVCVAFALEFAGCKGGSGGTATTEPAAAMGATNSAATNAMMAADTNASSTVSTNQ